MNQITAKNMHKQYILISILLVILNHTHATTLVIPPNGNIVGEIHYTYPLPGETLSDVGLRFDLGYYEMINANPGIDPTAPVPSSKKLLIPSQFILPKAPHQGIVINLAEYRLYFFPEGDDVVMTYPIGIGRKGWSTPIGLTKVVSKEINPAWHPSEALRKEGEKHGAFIPDVFPPGRGNPLGKHLLRLAWPTYLIHGTNNTDSIGERVSAGCIRMLPADIEYLYKLVKIGTAVRVVDESVKIGQLNGVMFMEIHPLLSEQNSRSLQGQVYSRIAGLPVKRSIVNKEIHNPSGVPVKIS